MNKNTNKEEIRNRIETKNSNQDSQNTDEEATAVRIENTNSNEENENTYEEEDTIQPKIFNLSKKTLSRYQINILSRGLKFTPTPKRDNIHLKSDIQSYTRKLRLLEFFHNTSKNTEKENLFKIKSSFTPPRNRDKDLDHQIDILNNLDLENIEHNSKTNLSNKEQQELSKLINDEEIIIKRADKGGAVVILSKSHYQQMILEHLNDKSTYQKLDKNMDDSVIKNRSKLLKKYDQCFTKDEKKYLNEKYYETSNFYGLPKIHKSELIEKAIKLQKNTYIEQTEPEDLKIRPIVGGPKCPTKNLSSFIDTILKPFLKHIKSYIRDSVDFLNKCQREVDINTKIATFDVVSLYTNIPHEFGLEALDYYLTNYPEDLNPKFNKNFVLEAADFILKNNICFFDKVYYLQIKGTAMGTIFAPTYANLTMGYHEVKLYSIIKNTYNLTVSKYFRDNWFRFLDDCQILLINNIEPKDLLHILNQINANIKFTMEISENKLPFLDVMINKNGTKIWMDIYSKPTDSKRYVPFNSNHPKHCLKNIPFSLARRICTIVEDESIKKNKLLELRNLLTKQFYPKTLIDTGIKKAKDIPQHILRKQKERGNKEIIPFISTFNPNNPKVFPIIKQSFNNFKYSKTLENVFRNKTLINCTRQAPNLERILCKSKFIYEKQTYKSSKCGKNCYCCPYILESSTYKFKKVKKDFYIKTNFNCETANLIYVIICSGCTEEYIGETGCILKERVNIYRQHIKQPEYQQIKAEEHLRLCGKGQFSIFPFFKIKENNKFLRKAYETYFINKYEPVLNKKLT